VVANYPVSVVMDGQGFNITVTSNSGQMHFGLIGCRELVPDIDVIAGYLVEELDKLLKLAHEVDGA
jgi:diacylglycerol O-acyltransferase / wax synthase